MSVGQGPNPEERQEGPMRRSIVHPHAGKIHYEIRDIVAVAKTIESRWHIPIIWENIGDPVKKGETVPEWIRAIVAEKVRENYSYAYSETEGIGESREFLAAQVNQRRTQDLQLEVCATSLPQLCIPAIMGNPQYEDHLKKRKNLFAQRTQEAREAFQGKKVLPLPFPKGPFIPRFCLTRDSQGEPVQIEGPPR